MSSAFKPITQKFSNHCTVGAFACVQGWRDSMEDGHVLLSNNNGNGTLASVFDGHGGKVTSQHLEKIFALQEEFSVENIFSEYDPGIQALYEQTDQKLRSVVFDGSGSTATTIWIKKQYSSIKKQESLINKQEFNVKQKRRLVSKMKEPLSLKMMKPLPKNETKSETENELKQETKQEELKETDDKHKQDRAKEPENLIDNLYGQEIEPSAESPANGPVHAIVANVGDSRVVVFRIESNDPVFETQDHKPSNKLEKSRIQQSGHFVYNDRVDGMLNLSRAFGDYRYKNNQDMSIWNLGQTEYMQEDEQNENEENGIKEIGQVEEHESDENAIELDEIKPCKAVICNPDITRLDLNKHDFVLVACDGVYETLSTESVVQFLNQEIAKILGEVTATLTDDNLEAIVTELINHCLSSGSTDNISAILLQIK